MSSEIQALQESISKRVQNDSRREREQNDSLYMEPAAPLLKVGRLANEFHGSTGSIRPGPESVATGIGNSYTEALAQKRDSEAVSRMPRSAKSWESEQQRPGSWHSGVGTMRTVGFGSSTTIGVARPLFQQKDN
jgi:hypothetical protein